MVLPTKEVRILEFSVDRHGLLEDNFPKMSTRPTGVPEELSENIRSAPTEDEGEVRRETPLSSSPLTSQMLQSEFDETLLLEKTRIHSFYAEKIADFSSPQKANIPHFTHLLPNQKPPADLTVVTHEDVLKMDQDNYAQLRPESTEAIASPPDGVKTPLVPSKDVPPWEAKLLPASCEDHRAQRNHICQVPQEEDSVFSLGALQMKNTALTEKKLESSKKVWSSTTTAVAVPSSGDQMRVGSTLDTEGPSLRELPQSGLSCSGSSH